MSRSDAYGNETVLKLCGALGLDSAMVQKLSIHIEPDSFVALKVDRCLNEDEVNATEKALMQLLADDSLAIHDQPPRRLALLAISGELLREVLHLPVTTQIEGAYYDRSRDEVLLRIEDRGLSLVQPGQVIPRVEVIHGRQQPVVFKGWLYRNHSPAEAADQPVVVSP